MGRQELEAELLSDVPGALWMLDWLDRDRVARAPEQLRRIVVAIDPAMSTNEGSDETGIVVAGVDRDGHGYILEDLSGRYAPHEWAAKAVIISDTRRIASLPKSTMAGSWSRKRCGWSRMA